MNIRQFSTIAMILLWLALAACQAVPVTTGTMPATTNQVASEIKPHTRMMETPVDTLKRGAVIFSIEKAGKREYRTAVERIIRAFAESAAPLDVAVVPAASGLDLQNIEFLLAYSDAGIIDISIDGNDAPWLSPDVTDTQVAYSQLKASLVKAREQLKALSGTAPAACLFPADRISKNNYDVVAAAGFRILCTMYAEDFPASKTQLNWSDKADQAGLYRLPIAGYADYTGGAVLEAGNSRTPSLTREILSSVDDSIRSFGVAVIVIDPEYFTGSDIGSQAAKIEVLTNLVKASRQYGDIVTFDGWSRARHRFVRPYQGGAAIIFRLDDVSKGFHEDVDEEILKMFQRNGFSVDCGVISNAAGMVSYEMPWLKKYVDDGTAGISVHGYDWTYYQMDTSRSNLTFEFLRDKFIQAREQYLKYFGVSPVAFTVPTDFYDYTGYKAINAAGFKIFSTLSAIEKHKSLQPVNYYGERDANGMYRLPTAMDVCDWDSTRQQWGDIYDISVVPSLRDYCRNEMNRIDKNPYVFSNSICNELGELDLAVISIHPAGFVNKDAKPDLPKLKKLESVVRWASQTGTIITFEQWYNYISHR